MTEQNTMTEAEIEAIVNDAEFIAVLLSEKGARHMIGTLTFALAGAYTALSEDIRETAIAGHPTLFNGALEVFKGQPLVN